MHSGAPSINSDTSAWRVMVADDHIVLQSGIRALIEPYGFTVAATQTEAPEVIATFEASNPDVLLLDVTFGLDNVAGIIILEELLRRRPDARVVLFSQQDELSMVRRAYQAGAMGVVTKRMDQDALIKVLSAAVRGQVSFPPGLAQRIAADELRPSGPSGQQGSLVAELSPREKDVFLALARARTVLEVARDINLSPKTVANIKTSIKNKLGVSSSQQLTQLAEKLGLLNPLSSGR